MPIKSFTGFTGIVALFLLAILSGPAHALVITIEPDDYSLGADLTNISPYVTLQSISPSFPSTHVGSIYADANGALGKLDYVAPTGNLTFGNHAFFVFSGEPNVGGFSMNFHQSVSSVFLLANSEYPPGLLALWAAFDRDGNEIGRGSAGDGVPLGDTFEIDIKLNDIWSVVVGGDASTAAINFDHLVFEIADSVSVPEPGSLLLLLSALLLLIARKKVIQQKHSRVAVY